MTADDKNRCLKLVILVLFYMWEDTRNQSFTCILNTQAFILFSLYPEFPSGFTIRAAARVDGFMVATSLFLEMADDILSLHIHLVLQLL